MKGVVFTNDGLEVQIMKAGVNKDDAIHIHRSALYVIIKSIEIWKT